MMTTRLSTFSHLSPCFCKRKGGRKGEEEGIGMETRNGEEGEEREEGEEGLGKERREGRRRTEEDSARERLEVGLGADA